MHRTVILAAAVLLTLVAAGSAERRKELERLRDEIKAEIGTPAAEELSQCRTMALGVKPCGGPWMYLVYSTAVSDETKLRKLVDEFNELDRKRNEEDGLFSDCSVVSEPKVTLADGVCSIARSDR